MKKIFLFTALFGVILFLYSCDIVSGGVIGNIEKYSFNGVEPDSLKSALNKVYIKYPELIKTDSKYGVNDGEDFYYILNTKDEKIVFLCNIITYDYPSSNEMDLSLTSAVGWGQLMELAPNMGFFEKRKYRKLFERNILPKIHQALDEIGFYWRLPSIKNKVDSLPLLPGARSQ